MSVLSVRLPDSLHEAAEQLATKDHVSLDELIATALAEKISASMTEQYLEERAKRGNRQAFEAAMARVPDVEPAEADRFPH